MKFLNDIPGLIKKYFQYFLDIILNKICDELYKYYWVSKDLEIPSKVKLNDINEFFKRVGISRGSTLFIHSSWKHLSNGNFNTFELLNNLSIYVGENGTIAMPAFPPSFLQKPNIIFNEQRTPSGAGLLSDSFRRYPGVKRSINQNHSVCAIGPDADYLTKDHQFSETSWDHFSPYYRLRDLEDSWIVGLGVGHRLKVATSLHCVESALWKNHKFFKKLFREEICYEYLTSRGLTGHHCYRKRSGHIYPPKLAKYFSKEELVEECINGLEVYAIRAQTLIDKAITLGQEGKTMYIWPIPWFNYFRR